MAAAVIGIDHDLDRQMLDLAAQLIGMMTQDNDGSTYPALPDHTDDAFDKLPSGTVEALLKKKNKRELVGLLKDHVVKGKLTSKELATKSSVRT